MPERNDHMTFRECLPEGCPPTEAEEIVQTRVVFRLVSAAPPTDEDFRSERAEFPTNQFDVPECIVRGVSVFSNIGAARRLLRARRHKGKLVCQVTLRKGAGFILKTGGRSHFTWWPSADFDILNNCQVRER